MKITTDHLPFIDSWLTSTNLPLWKACVLKAGTVVLMSDMSAGSGGFAATARGVKAAMAGIVRTPGPVGPIDCYLKNDRE